MGNCLKPVDPLFASIPRSVDGIDISPIKESRLPIIFLIGGPGAGKRTQCMRVAGRYGFHGIKSSDVLRDEVATGTQRAVILARIMSEGRLVPSEVMVQLLETRMLRDLAARSRGFLLCGFPRVKEQCKLFDRVVRPPDLVLYLCVRNSLLMDRILGRIVTATERQERSFDDVKRRIRDFGRRNRPVLRYYRKRVIVIDGEKDESEVFQDICEAIDNALSDDLPNAAAVKATN